MNGDDMKQSQIWFPRSSRPEEGVAYEGNQEWLQGKANWEQKHLRNEYMKARAAYSKVVKKSKRV